MGTRLGTLWAHFKSSAASDSVEVGVEQVGIRVEGDLR